MSRSEHMVAAAQRLDSAERSSSRIWRERHLRAARRHIDDALGEIEEELRPRPRVGFGAVQAGRS